MSSLTAYTGRITDLSLSEVTIEYSRGRTHTVALDPPMKSYREARERLVDMDKTCRDALGISDIAVRRYVAPYGWTLGLFIQVIVTLVVFSRRSNLETGLAHMLPEGFRSFCWQVQPLVFWGILVIHTIEVAMFARSRLAKHGVNPRSILYWQWLSDAFISGFGAFHRYAKQKCTFLRIVKANACLDSGSTC